MALMHTVDCIAINQCFIFLRMNNMQTNTAYAKNVRTKPKAEAFKRPQSVLKGQGKAWTRETIKTSQNAFKAF